MATVHIKEPREQAAHFGLYRTSAGGQQGIVVRRKVGEPTDYMHTKSRKLKRQRDNLSLASQHYAQLTPSQKALTRQEIEYIEYQKSHGKTITKLLQGRQLFIAKEMRSLETTGKRLLVPFELCIMLTDEVLNPLAGELWLYCTVSGDWSYIKKDEIGTGNWLFSRVPPGYAPYRPYGEAEGYYDPLLPETQAMTENEIKAYHYHIMKVAVPIQTLRPRGNGDIIELEPKGLLFNWQCVLNEDSTWYPDGVYIWGHCEGNYVTRGWFPMVHMQDLYYLTEPEYIPARVARLTICARAGRTYYPYGNLSLSIKTHGQVYYSDQVNLNIGLNWYYADFPKNPYTGLDWTGAELMSLQAGQWLSTPGSYGRTFCDQLYVEVEAAH